MSGVSISQLSRLQALLKPLLPRSIFVYNTNQLLLSGRLPKSAESRVLVDDSESLFLSAVAEPLSQPSLWGAAVFCRQKEPDTARLADFLRASGLFDGPRPLVLHVESGVAAETVWAISQESDGEGRWVVEDFMVNVQGEDREWSWRPTDESLSRGPLSGEDGAFMAASWGAPYLKEAEVWADRARFLPSYGVRSSGGKLEAITTTSPIGFCTHGYVAKAYRNQSLFRACGELVGREQRELGLVPFAFLARHNLASDASMKIFGLRTVEDLGVHVLAHNYPPPPTKAKV